MKQQRNKDCKKEEDVRKQREDKERRTATMTATASVTQAVSPDVPMESEMQDIDTNSSLISLMNGDSTDATDSNDDNVRSLVKNKPRKLGTTDPTQKTTHKTHR